MTSWGSTNRFLRKFQDVPYTYKINSGINLGLRSTNFNIINRYRVFLFKNSTQSCGNENTYKGVFEYQNHELNIKFVIVDSWYTGVWSLQPPPFYELEVVVIILVVSDSWVFLHKLPFWKNSMITCTLWGSPKSDLKIMIISLWITITSWVWIIEA